MPVYKKALKEISLDEITKRLSIDKRRENIPKAEPKVNLKFGNGKEKGTVKENEKEWPVK